MFRAFDWYAIGFIIMIVGRLMLPGHEVSINGTIEVFMHFYVMWLAIMCAPALRWYFRQLFGRSVVAIAGGPVVAQQENKPNGGSFMALFSIVALTLFEVAMFLLQRK